jgi:hypothetical protein
VPVLQQEGKGRNDTAWFWQYSKPGGLVYFDYQDSRSRAGPSHFLSDFKGRLQTDGYEVYTALVLNTAEDKIQRCPRFEQVQGAPRDFCWAAV